MNENIIGVLFMVLLLIIGIILLILYLTGVIFKKNNKKSAINTNSFVRSIPATRRPDKLCDKYYEVGTTNDIKPFSIKTTELSAGNNSCTAKCDSDPECLGVIYKNNECSLLKDIDVNVKYDENLESNVFMKKVNDAKRFVRPRFAERAFLFKEEIPNRFWEGKSDDIKILQPNKLYKLSFIPSIGIIDNELGVFKFSNSHDFSKKIVERSRTKDSYVNTRGLDMNEDSIYVKYVLNKKSKILEDINIAPVVEDNKKERVVVEKIGHFTDREKESILKLAKEEGVDIEFNEKKIIKLEKNRRFTEEEIEEILKDKKEAEIRYGLISMNNNDPLELERCENFTDTEIKEIKNLRGGKLKYLLTILV